jgi:endonuclease/exonuclease/phosphatase family metal-dependent hydrolase
MRFKGRLRPHLVRDEPRVAVVATIDTPVGELTAVCTHLSFIPWWNARQLHRVVRATTDAHGPVVVMGDLNTGPERAGRITGLRSAAMHPTFPVDAPREQLDHILVRGDLSMRASAAPAMPISDHRALWAELAGPERVS